MPRNAFRRVANVRAETHTPDKHQLVGEVLTRAPIRLLSARAPRQAVLRASFRLAPSLTTEPCDPTVEKTRDTFNRRLPPVRLACTRTSCVPGSLPQLSLRGRPEEFGLLATDQGFLGFHDRGTASADRHRTLRPRGLVSEVRERGRFLPTVPTMRSYL